MHKPLCIISFVVSLIVLILFTLNLVTSVPFGSQGGLTINLGMITGAGVIAVFSVLTYLKE